MGPDSTPETEAEFELFRKRIVHVTEGKDLNSSMFAFGIFQGNARYKGDEFWQRRQAIKLFDDDIRTQWDPQLFLRVQSGKDDSGKMDDDYGGVVHWEYCIKRAAEFNRPDWAFYYWIGFLKGLVNSRKEEPSEFLRCLQFIPVSFFERHGEQITELCNYFDETGEHLHLNIQQGKLNAWFE